MRAVFGGSLAGARKIDGHSLQRSVPETKPQQNQQSEPAKPVRPATRPKGDPIYFRDLAYMAWPKKTEQNLAFYARVDPRTARRWLSDDTDPPADVLGLILAEIMQRYHQRD